MNDNLKHMWNSVRSQKLPSHKKFRHITLEEKAENRVKLKVDPDYTSKERKNVR